MMNAWISKYHYKTNTKYPNLKDVCCATDGLKLRVEKSGSEFDQSMFYNNWIHDHQVRRYLFLFFPNGKIGVCYLNAPPGMYHDSVLAEMGNIYDKVNNVFTTRSGKMVVDSGVCTK